MTTELERTWAKTDMSRKAYEKLAARIVEHPRMKQVLDKANQDHDGFRMWLADMLREDGCYELPDSMQHALNSGDGVYRP